MDSMRIMSSAGQRKFHTARSSDSLDSAKTTAGKAKKLRQKSDKILDHASELAQDASDLAQRAKELDQRNSECLEQLERNRAMLEENSQRIKDIKKSFKNLDRDGVIVGAITLLTGIAFGAFVFIKGAKSLTPRASFAAGCCSLGCVIMGIKMVKEGWKNYKS